MNLHEVSFGTLCETQKKPLVIQINALNRAGNVFCSLVHAAQHPIQVCTNRFTFCFVF